MRARAEGNHTSDYAHLANFIATSFRGYIPEEERERATGEPGEPAREESPRNKGSGGETHKEVRVNIAIGNALDAQVGERKEKGRKVQGCERGEERCNENDRRSCDRRDDDQETTTKGGGKKDDDETEGEEDTSDRSAQ